MHFKRFERQPSNLFSSFFLFALIVSFSVCPSTRGQTLHKNVLLICVDDLRPELNSFGASYIHSPNIDALAKSGRAFHRHYVNAPSCGPSRYTLLTGRYGPGDNNALFKRSALMKRVPDAVSPSMPEWFRRSGYITVSVGKVSHHPGGLGGGDWNDEKILEMPNAWDRHIMPTGRWLHPRGAMHGLANGEIRSNTEKMALLQTSPGPDSIYPDGLITQAATEQIQQLAASDQPFFLAVGLIRPHLPFGAPKPYMSHYVDVQLPPIAHPNKPQGRTTWHGSGEFMRYFRDRKDPRDDPQFADEVRRHYAACVSYADAQVGRIVKALNDSHAADDTIIVLWGDHGWHLGEHGVWGKHTLFEESLHSPLIFVTPEISRPGEPTQAMVSTVDIFPTLCELSGGTLPEFTVGESLLPQLADPTISGHDVVAYFRNHATIRTDDKRLIVKGNGNIELYDHAADGETNNIADQRTEWVEQLKSQLSQALATRWVE